jgi:hypothetical protein
METLGLSGSIPRTEGRLKSLFWPSIQNGTDVDYLGVQGYWVCTIVGVSSLVFNALSGQTIVGIFVLLYYYLGGVGVRERSRYAAVAVLVFYVVDMLSGVGVLKVLFAALLLSNLRATWIASGWQSESEEAALPPRLNETWGDKFADQLPMWLWPKIRLFYYIYSVCVLVLVDIGIAVGFAHRAR